MPRTAAVIVHYGDARPTLDCLRSVTRSNQPAAAVVVDNQGNATAWISAADCSPQLLSPATNLGFGRAANLGIAWALAQDRFDSVLLLNNDATLRPDTLAHLERALDRRERAGLAVPRVLLDGARPALWYGGGDVDWGRGSATVAGVGGDPDSPGALAERDVTFASGCVLLLRLEALREVGGFDPRYFLYEEDLELGLRLQEAGWHLRYVPEAVALHEGQVSQRGADEPFRQLQDPHNPRWAQLLELQTCNRLLSMHRHARGPRRVRFRLLFPVHWAARCLRLVAAGRIGAPHAVWRGWSRYRHLRRQPIVDELAALERDFRTPSRGADLGRADR